MNRRLASWLAVFGLALFATQAQAQTYPQRPVTLVVGFAAGGSTDLIARLVAQRLGDAMGQQFLVENRPGGGGRVAYQGITRAPADGYTLVLATIGMSIHQGLYPDLPYDAVKSFTHIAPVAETPNILVVNPAFPAQNVRELIDIEKKEPGKVTFASSGIGTSLHLTGELFNLMAGVKMTHIPYKGSGPALQDLLGGQVPVMFDNLTTSLPHVQSGKLRALAVTSSTRVPSLPDIPTLAEAGVPGFDSTAWYGLMGPAGLPEPIVKRLNAELAKIMSDPEVKKRLAELGTFPLHSSPADFTKFIAKDVEKWKGVVKAAGVKPE